MERRHQEDRVCAISPGFINLVFVNDKVFSQNGPIAALFAGISQIFKITPEMIDIRQHRNG